MQEEHSWTAAVKRGLSDVVDTDKDPFAFSHGLTGVDQTGNYLWVDVFLGCFGCIIGMTLIIRFMRMYNSHLRLLAPQPNHPGSLLKKHIIYAPLWKKRHNEEIRLSSAISIGTLPSRFHMLILVVYGMSNVAYCLCLPWSRSESASVVAALRGRSGTLAALNLIPTILFALRNNPLIWMLHVSYDTFNLLHRWAARVVIIESVVHTLCWMINTVNAGNWSSIGEHLAAEPSYAWGMVGTAFFVFLFIQAWSPLRHAFYETFINFHRLGVAFAIVGVWIHVDLHALPQLPWMKLCLGMWVVEWLLRLWKVTRYNVSMRRGMSKVTIEALPNDACRVTIDLVRSWNHRPGSHVHLYPAPPQHACFVEDEKLGLPTTSPGYDLTRPNLMMKTQPMGVLTTYGMIEGPYGGHESLDSYGTCILFAAGVGITHQTSFVRHLVAGYHGGTVAARKVVLCWSIPNTECLEWGAALDG
ncbi:FAD-binding 8 [Botryosphaeria dothidea]|uniref:FAD-binding 8 n=1 Tax=Botryosphaeria dothidea TaxID=55169 RepID=A0A8H4MYU0_9PEZI|nr:FAD-binding 8 [Botryosphaeria dothidea]